MSSSGNWGKWGKHQPQIIEYICNKLIHEYQRNILDVGCGDGKNSLYMAKLGHNIICVDTDLESIRSLENEATKRGLEKYIQTQVLDITIYKPDMCFDVIILSFVLHFIREDIFEQVVHTIYSWLTLGGIIIIGDFYGDGPIKNPEIYHSFTELNIHNLIHSNVEMLVLKKEEMCTRAGDIHPGFWLLLKKIRQE